MWLQEMINYNKITSAELNKQKKMSFRKQLSLAETGQGRI